MNELEIGDNENDQEPLEKNCNNAKLMKWIYDAIYGPWLYICVLMPDSKFTCIMLYIVLCPAQQVWVPGTFGFRSNDNIKYKNI